jgi:UPF0176 protein
MFVSLAGYQFAALDDLTALRDNLRSHCKTLDLRGTILLSTEGINVSVCGTKAHTDSLLQRLRAHAPLHSFAAKVSPSPDLPFTRMLVKIKKNIIAFGAEGIDPINKPSPRVSARSLKQWLDEGRPITLIDTRNDYEIELGTFSGALPARIGHFRDFPAAVRRLPEALKERTLVTFCTGGIRCEKAAPYMELAGFKDVYQLDGGILKYFEECGGAHYEGGCFVFDKRVALSPTLNPTGDALCFKCLMPVSIAAQADARYVPEQSCPRCDG